MIDVKKIAKELTYNQAKCPSCKGSDLGASPKEFALPRYHDTIGGLDAKTVVEVAVVQCRDCSCMLFFNAANYKVDT